MYAQDSQIKVTDRQTDRDTHIHTHLHTQTHTSTHMCHFIRMGCFIYGAKRCVISAADGTCMHKIHRQN